MRFKKSIKYFDVLIIALISIVAYKIIENYLFFFDICKSIVATISPFIYAFLFAYALNPIMKLFERRVKVKRSIAILFTYLLIFIIIGLICVFLIPSMFDSIVSLIGHIPDYVNTAQNWINDILKNDKIYEFMNQAGLMDAIHNFTSRAGDILMNVLENSITSIVGITTDIIKIGFGFLISIYLLYDKEKICKGLKTIFYIILKEKNASLIIRWIKTYNEMIGKYIGIKAIDSTIIGVMALIGLLIIGAPYAIIIALIVGVTNMIPYFGPLIGEIAGFIFGIFVSPSIAIITVVFLFALQQFDAWFLDPKLIGKKVGVQPYLIIIAVTIGGAFFGILGMLLASPTIATIKLCYDGAIKSYLSKNKELENAIENKTEALSEEYMEEEKSEN